MANLSRLRVVPYESSVVRNESNSGISFVHVLASPAAPTSLNPILVPERNVAVAHSSVELAVSGNIGCTYLMLLGPDYDEVLLQDADTGDLLYSHVDLVFTLKSTLIKIRKRQTDGSHGAFDMLYVQRSLMDFIDDWATNNPWAIISAFATGRYRDDLPTGVVLGPEYGEFAISEFTGRRWSDALVAASQIGGGVNLRLSGSNPVVAGTVEYAVDPAETDHHRWGIRCSGSLALRMKTAGNTISIIQLTDASDWDKSYARFTPSEQGVPVLPGGVSASGAPSANAPVGGAIPPTDPSPNPIVPVEPDPGDGKNEPSPISTAAAKKSLNNLLTGMFNWSGYSGSNQSPLSYLTSTQWRADIVGILFYQSKSISNAQFGKYPQYDAAGTASMAVSTGDDNESAICMIRSLAYNATQATAVSHHRMIYFLDKYFRSISDEDAIALADAWRELLVTKVDRTNGAGSIDAGETFETDFDNRVFVRLRQSDSLTTCLGMRDTENHQNKAPYLWMSVGTYSNTTYIRGWHDKRLTKAALTELIKSSTRNKAAIADAMLSWPIAGKASTTSGSAADAFSELTWADYIAFLGFTPSTTNTEAVDLFSV